MANGLIQQLDNLANSINTQSGTTAGMTIEEMNTAVAENNYEIETQTDLIEQIQNALIGKVGGGGGPSLEETSIFDPTQETIIHRSTASHKTLMLTKNDIIYVNTGKYAEYVGCKFDAEIGKTYKISWEMISSSEQYVFYYESDTILTQVDDHYGTRIPHSQNPFYITATKPYIYLYAAHPAVPSYTLVAVLGLMVHEEV